jgi:hypothetical protein
MRADELWLAPVLSADSRLPDGLASASLRYSITTAQATEVLLKAIAASDGSRASVTRNMFRTRVKNGVLGSFQLG